MRKTQKLVDKLLEELERTGIPLTACSKVGVGRSTYYRWRQESYFVCSVCRHDTNRSPSQCRDASDCNSGYFYFSVEWHFRRGNRPDNENRSNLARTSLRIAPL